MRDFNNYGASPHNMRRKTLNFINYLVADSKARADVTGFLYLVQHRNCVIFLTDMAVAGRIDQQLVFAGAECAGALPRRNHRRW